MRLAVVVAAIALAPHAAADTVPYICVPDACAGEIDHSGCSPGSNGYGFTGAWVDHPFIRLNASALSRCSADGRTHDHVAARAPGVIVDWWTDKDAEGARESGVLAVTVGGFTVYWFESGAWCSITPALGTARPCVAGGPPDAPQAGGRTLP